MLGPLLLGVLGLAFAGLIVWDAFETILVPRRIGRRFRFTRWFYAITWRIWRGLALGIHRPSRRDALIGTYGPLSLILLLGCWAAGLIFAFAVLALAIELGTGQPRQSFGVLLYLSGETFFTLGFGDVTPTTTLGRLTAVVEAGLGFGFLGTVVGYLPTMYAAFSQREIEISLMDVSAGSPPTAAEFLRRTGSAGGRLCNEQLRVWERWAAQLLENHISYPQLAYYRSQHGNQSWLASLTTILDASATIIAASDDGERSQAHRTFAMARHAVVDITQLFLQGFEAPHVDRLGPEARRAVLATLERACMQPPSPEAFASRLDQLRLLYEPYAQALSAYLLFDLPPWAHGEARRDNWERGPWDRMLPGTEQALRRDDHF